MSYTKQFAGAAAGMISCLSLIAYTPPAGAAEGVDLGRARNDIGNVQPGGTSDGPGATNTGFTTSDAVIASVAGLLVAGGGIGAIVAARRRQPAAHSA